MTIIEWDPKARNFLRKIPTEVSKTFFGNICTSTIQAFHMSHLPQ